MANRTVSVILQAEIGSYVAGLTKAAVATKGFGDNVETSATKATKGFDLAGRGAMLFGAAAAGALVGVVTKSAEFEKSMSGVQAATQASAATMGQLREAALKAGSDTQYSATQAADAITEMAKAGISAKDIMAGGLTGALNLAAAGQLDVAEAAQIASVAMKQFGLSGEQLPHVADLLAAGAGKAVGSVDDLGQALNQAGLIAASTGISIEETTGTLAAFASAGLLGSDAGTSLKTMLQRLQAPSQEAAGIMSDLGISAYDAQGNFVGLESIAGQLHDKLGGLTQAQRDNALATIFGSDAVRAANVLYTQGADGIAEWTNKVNDAGYAQRQAAQLTDNLAGDLERLGGAFDTFLISAGSGAQGPLRTLVQSLTGLVDTAGNVLSVVQAIPTPLLAAAAAFAAWSKWGSPITSMIETLAIKSLYLKDAIAGGITSLDGMKKAAAGLAASINPLGILMGTLAVYAVDFATEQSEVDARMRSVSAASETLRGALMRQGGAWDEVTRKAADSALETAGLTTAMDAMGLSSSRVNLALQGNQHAYDATLSAMQDYDVQQNAVAHGIDPIANGLAVLSGKATENADAFERLAGSMNYTAQVVGNLPPELLAWAQGVTDAGDATAATVPQVDAATQALQDWITKLAGIDDAFVDPLGTYQEMLQAAAQSTADATASQTDSWSDFVDSATVSMDQYAAKLEEQIANQQNWQTNLGIIAQRAGLDVAQQLALMGTDGVQLVAQMANGTDAEMQRMAGLLRQDAQLAGAGAATALDTQMKVMAAIGAQGANATATGIAQQLGLGLGQVQAIAAQYGINLASGINPLLIALGKTPVMTGGGGGRAVGQAVRNADGNLYERHSAEIAPAGSWRVWAEPETGGEAYIPLAPGKRTRSLNIWAQTGRLLGVQGFAGGGFASAGAVPKPSSTAPYGPPISSGGDAAMSTEYDAATAWINANPPFVASAMPKGGAGGAARWASVVLQALSMMGQPASLLATVLRRMNQESGGNQFAINNWDINAKRGTPSKGLMQTIDPTFRAYHDPRTSWNVYDPLANILASMRYAIARYGSLSAAYNKAGGYENGTDFVPETGPAVLHKGEAVLTREQAESYRAGLRSREMSGTVGGYGGGSGAVTVNVSGATIEGRFEIGGDGLARIVDGRIVQAVTTIIDRGRYNP